MNLTALQSGTSAAQNLAAGASGIQGYAAAAGRVLWPMLRLSGLNGAAADFTVTIRNTTDGKTVNTFSESKGTAADTAADLVGTPFVAQAKTYAIGLSSTNASDTSVGVTVEWYDATQADVVGYGGTAGTFAAGRPQVNTSHVAGTAQTAADVGAGAARALTALPNAGAGTENGVPTSLLLARAMAGGYGSVIFVRKDGNNANTGTNPGEPKLTVAAGVAAVANGGLVIVGEGTYAEAVDLSTKSGVTLRGVGYGTVITRSSRVGTAGATVKLGPSCTLERLRVQQTAVALNPLEAYSVFGTTGSDGTTIRDCWIDSTDVGIASQFAYSLTVERCLITASEYAIYVTEGSGVIRDNEIRHTGWTICSSIGIGVNNLSDLNSPWYIARNSIYGRQGDVASSDLIGVSVLGGQVGLHDNTINVVRDGNARSGVAVQADDGVSFVSMTGNAVNLIAVAQYSPPQALPSMYSIRTTNAGGVGDPVVIVSASNRMDRTTVSGPGIVFPDWHTAAQQTTDKASILSAIAGVPALVWAFTTRTLTTLAGLITGSTVTVQNIVDTSDGNRLNLVAGDDYTDAGRVPSWRITGYTGPALATATLRVTKAKTYATSSANGVAPEIEVPATAAVDGADLVVSAPIPESESILLTGGTDKAGKDTHRYQLIGYTADAHDVTLVIGPSTVLRRVNPEA